MLWPIVLTLVGLLAAFLPVSLGLSDLPDVIPLAVMGAGLVWGWIKWRQKKGKLRFFYASLQTVLGGLLVFFLFVATAYAPANAVPAVGAPAPEISAVRVRDGASFHLAAQRGNGVVLVFFRGSW